MYDIAGLAQDLQMAITDLEADSDSDAIDTLAKYLVPVLQYLQSAPTRAIVLTVVVGFLR